MGAKKKMKKLHSSRNSYLPPPPNGESLATPRAEATALEVKDRNKRHKDRRQIKEADREAGTGWAGPMPVVRQTELEAQYPTGCLHGLTYVMTSPLQSSISSSVNKVRQDELSRRGQDIKFYKYKQTLIKHLRCAQALCLISRGPQTLRDQH